LFAVAMLAVRRPDLRAKLHAFRDEQDRMVRSEPLT
jgi:phosphoribosylcarboxyaminoimidazole (NCAIR) mutase